MKDWAVGHTRGYNAVARRKFQTPHVQEGCSVRYLNGFVVLAGKAIEERTLIYVELLSNAAKASVPHVTTSNISDFERLSP